ncbi:amidase domain-containing protein [Bifidobacterium dentium]|uniref:amidase domain-containing protein n=2 Tax=Bifidobacterium dentium TaxID=1689 RepID=UPI00080BF3DC|nr:amidase domain-containing protein [Bifidobacterium dentium]MBF9670099.1 amidase domain-containing protein [Bifidobacterium dentium]
MPKYIAAFLTMVLLLGGTAQVASAESDISQGQVQEILKEYNDSLQSAYFASNSRSSQNVPVTESTRQAEGLRTENVNISSEEISARHIDDGYEIQADVTVDSTVKPEEGTIIYTAGQQREIMTTSWTDRHVLKVVPSEGGWDIVSDKTIDVADEGNESQTSAEDTLSDDAQPSSTDEKGAWSSRALDMAKRNFGDNSAGVNYITLSRYADTWTNKQHEKQMNPKYPVFKNGNCANFASQALHEAGLSVTHLWNYSTVSPELLTTKSWMNANSNYYYMKNYSHSYTSLDNVWKAWQGSLLYVDWDSKDQKNEINHAMVVIGVVVKNGKANPVICQKTPNRNSITLTESLENAHKQKRYNMIWYGLQYKYE